MAHLNPKLRVKILKTATIANTPIKEGNLLIDQETGALYVDLESSRVSVGAQESDIISIVDAQLQLLETDLETRYQAMLADLDTSSSS